MQKNFSKKLVWTDTKFFLFKKNYIYIKIFCFKIFYAKFIMARISNQNLLSFIEEKTNDDIKKILLVFFPQIL